MSGNFHRSRLSHHDPLPSPATEEDDGDYGEDTFRAADGEVDAARSETGMVGQVPRRGKLHHPIAEEVDPRWCSCVAGTVEGLLHDHAPGVERVTEAHGLQSSERVRNHRGFV